ncbi:MAG: hypothetical protein A2Z99_18370 [Treponema sp. GWB1_62_6]|nr:MAG: hypothetical protein A2001_00535 [Treponema sp. GWC1_61_84]OHE69100.1 MAG: hypothetical protein A2Z99_18370 [Treponema sp. GWB1_62_6]HCM26485.1 hypothetical protein [Treponema sp.]
MDEKDVIVIGAGIAGLSAGCYAAMNGLKTEIHEMHTHPGGLCTSWKRGGYTFDYCIHWLVGSSPKSDFHKIWSDLGIMRERTFIDHEVFVAVENPDGRIFTLYTDPDKLQAHMKALFPADAKAVAGMCADIRRFSEFDMIIDPAFDLRTIGKFLGELPAFARMVKLAPLGAREYAERFSDPWLREIITNIFGMPEMPIFSLFMTLAWMHAGTAGYPIGGSLPMARAAEARFKELGGEIRYGSKVERVLVRDGKAVGVRLSDGTERYARYVVSAADAHATFKNFLADEYRDPVFERYFEEKALFPSLVQISLGVDRSFEGVAQTCTWKLAEPLLVDDGENGKPNTVRQLSLHHYGYDPTMAPKGKTALLVRLNGTPAFWRDLAKSDRPRYEAEKARVLSAVTKALDEKFPGLAERVEVSDVSTPWTCERYTGNWEGCMEGWKMTKSAMAETMSGKGLPATIAGLSNFRLAGQWLSPGGGLPPSANSGREAVKAICKAEGRRFRSS